MRCGSTAKVLAKRKLKHYRISECVPMDLLGHHMSVLLPELDGGRSPVLLTCLVIKHPAHGLA